MIPDPPELISPEEIERLSAQTEWLEMRGGRRLAYYQYGARDGIPTFFCHGSGSHVHATLFHKAAEKFGYRFIVPDRPGVGLSDFDPKRTILDGARDIAHLAGHLGIEKFGVAGLSGGGPTLFACAHAFPSRLKFVVDLACATPLFTDAKAIGELGLADRIFAKLGQWTPLALFQIPFAYLKRQMKTAESFARTFRSSMCPADAKLFENPTLQYMFLRDWQELFRQGTKEAALDAQLIYHPWGFDLRDIRCHVDVRHGTEDRWVPLSFSKYLETVVPDVTLHRLEGQGHFYHMVYAEEMFGMLEGKRQ
jgi:pimeloyl-ACP methyl ester carboxylesterase